MTGGPTVPASAHTEARRRGWTTWIVAALGYASSIAVATWPRIATFRTTLPTLGDPLQHLWILHWYRTCLLEGRWPVLCPEVQHPVGAPLGNYSPLPLPMLLYVPLSLVCSHDALCFNLIWLFGLVFTGLGTFSLIETVLRDRRCAALGGMLAMLSAPVLLHAREHLELIFVGGFPLFLAAWIGFLDAPSPRRLARAAGGYVLVALCAAYYAAFAMVPAVLYVAWWAGRRGGWPWLRARVGWLFGFSAVVGPVLAVVFFPQVWALAHGYAVPRPLQDFQLYSAPWWTYLTPTVLHRLGRLLLPWRPYDALGPTVTGEAASYLGVVTLALLAFAALGRVRFAQAGYWWVLLGVLIVLSLGAEVRLGPYRISLPALWLKRSFVAFRMVRVPARFNLFAAVVAALVASAGLKHLLDRLPSAPWRTATLTVLIVIALADLSIGSNAVPIPPRPACYDVIRRLQPDAAIVEVPQFASYGSTLNATCGYWQSQHRLRTSAGYCGHPNVRYDDLVVWNSPFWDGLLANPAAFGRSERTRVGITCEANLNDYIWLFLRIHRYDYVILHQGPAAVADWPVLSNRERLKARLAPARIFEDADTSVYEARRLPPPTRPVVLPTRGWRLGLDGRMVRVVGRSGRIAAYNPDATRPVRFAFEARSLDHPRAVRLLADGRELARWTVSPRRYDLYLSPPFLLPAGLQELTLWSDRASRPRHAYDAATAADPAPYSLKVAGLALTPAPAEESDGRVAAHDEQMLQFRIPNSGF
ncbi:MAG: hypothetical protein IRY99_12630 [Isosphaeraceae bacterium]|nr:hypothetical protein [Isosphaeraceae bacterium]